MRLDAESHQLPGRSLTGEKQVPRRMRVCHIAATNEGATWMLEQLRELRDVFNFDVTAIISGGSGALAGSLRAAGIPFHTFDFDFPSDGRLSSLLIRVRRLAELLDRERFDIVHTHLFNSMVLGRMAAWLADVPVRVAMIAGPYHLEAYTPRWIDVSTAWMESGIIASCEYTRSLYRSFGVPERRLFLTYYGADERKFEPGRLRPAEIRREYQWPEDAPVIAMIAYFYPMLPKSRWTPTFLHDRANKRHEDLIIAAPLVLREFPDAKFLFVGSGWGEAGTQHYMAMIKLAEDIGIKDSVHFSGYRSDIGNVLSAIDVSVQAALSENLGGTIESLLVARPVVATRTGGMVDAIHHEVTGLLVEPLEPADLARAIVRLLRDPQAARSMALAGRTLMLERFTLKRTASDLAAIYGQLLGDVSPSGRRGYRTVRQYVRRLVAALVFPYLALRLAFDLKFLARWDSGWRPFGWAHRFVEAASWCDPRRRIVSALGRFPGWLYLLLLRFYGRIRYMLKDTSVLEKWDQLFAFVRGRRGDKPKC